MDTKPNGSQVAWTCMQARNQSRFPSHLQCRDAQGLSPVQGCSGSAPSRSRWGRNSLSAGAGYAQEIQGLPVTAGHSWVSPCCLSRAGLFARLLRWGRLHFGIAHSLGKTGPDLKPFTCSLLREKISSISKRASGDHTQAFW